MNFSGWKIDFGGRVFWRCENLFSDEKSTSMADFDDAKLILAMQ